MKPCILVLGAPRSGTSLIAGTLHRLGCCMGRTFVDDLPRHPTGSYEDVILSSRLLCERSSPGRYLLQIEQKIEDLAGGVEEAWGIKSHNLLPVFSAVLPILQRYGDIRIVATVRPVRESLASSNSFPRPHPLTLEEVRRIWLDPIDALRASGQFPWLDVDFSERLDPRRLGHKLADFAGLTFTPYSVVHIDPSLSRFSGFRDLDADLAELCPCSGPTTRASGAYIHMRPHPDDRDKK